VIERDATLGSYAQRQQLEARLTAALRAHLPRPVAPLVRVAGSDSRCLELAASGGAVAATLRQRTPDLLAALRREGWDFTEIRVRVQVRGLVTAPVKASKNQRDASGASTLFALGERLPEGPLRRSLARWSRRARGRG
jgi:hypothetical protein